MQTHLLDVADIKTVYDSQGIKQEVIISYEYFQEIEAFLERHAYFYTDYVQKRLQKSDEDLQAGRYIEVGSHEIDKALAWLHE